MACNNCGQQKKNCGCTSEALTINQVCNPIVCPIDECSESFPASCIRYTGSDIICDNTTLVASGENLAQAIANISAFFCTQDKIDNDIICNQDTIASAGTSINDALDLIVQYFCNSVSAITIVNTGFGEPIANDIVGPAFTLRSLLAGQGIAIQTNTDDLTISSITPGLFAQIEDSIAVENTTTPMTLIGNGVGSLDIPADVFTVGDSFNGKFSGHISANNNNTLQLTIMAGAVTLADTGVMTLPGITNLEWTLNVDFTIRAIGGAGVASIVSSGTFVYEKDASVAMEGHTFSLIENTNFDTTVSNTLEVLATWGTADPGNSIYSEVFILKKIF